MGNQEWGENALSAPCSLTSVSKDSVPVLQKNGHLWVVGVAKGTWGHYLSLPEIAIKET